MTVFDNKCQIPDQIKTTIGRLIVVIAATSEPAAKIHYTSSLISEVRSAMLIYIRYWRCETADTILWDLFRAMAISAVDASDPEVYERECAEAKRLVLYLKKHWEDKLSGGHEGNAIKADVAAYDTMRDYYNILGCRSRWQIANRIYFSNNDAWQYSNAMLADIHDIVIDICNKRDLIIIPKNQFFSIDELNNYGTFKPLETEQQHG